MLKNIYIHTCVCVCIHFIGKQILCIVLQAFTTNGYNAACHELDFTVMWVAESKSQLAVYVSLYQF